MIYILFYSSELGKKKYIFFFNNNFFLNREKNPGFLVYFANQSGNKMIFRSNSLYPLLNQVFAFCSLFPFLSLIPFFHILPILFPKFTSSTLLIFFHSLFLTRRNLDLPFLSFLLPVSVFLFYILNSCFPRSAKLFFLRVFVPLSSQWSSDNMPSHFFRLGLIIFQLFFLLHGLISQFKFNSKHHCTLSHMFCHCHISLLYVNICPIK